MKQLVSQIPNTSRSKQKAPDLGAFSQSSFPRRLNLKVVILALLAIMVLIAATISYSMFFVSSDSIARELGVTKAELCAERSKFAQAVMFGRQYGSRIDSFKKYKEIKSSREVVIRDELIFTAYDEAIETESKKIDAAIRFFRDRVHADCLKS